MRLAIALLLLAASACERQPDGDRPCNFDGDCARDEECVFFRCGAPLTGLDAGIIDVDDDDGTVLQPRRCTTKCECAAGEVCAGSVCAAAPLTCDGIDQCGRGADGDPCEDLICNSFTGRCFDDDPPPCVEDADCVDRPDCRGCTCTATTGLCEGASAGDACGDDVACAAGLGCDAGTCVEPCSGTDCAVDGCCVLSSLPCCNAFGICGDTGC